jgi:hypothetical protein
MTNPSANQTVTVLITQDGMGHADTELKHKLVRTYLDLLSLEDPLPDTICFYTEGIRMVIEGSPVLEELGALQRQGVRLIVCRTCVDHFGVADKVRVGEVGNMKEILTAQWDAEKVVTI